MARRPRTVNIEASPDGPAFPDPSSDPGRLLATLIAANVPGTVATWAAPDLATTAGLSPDEADAALAALVADRLVDAGRQGETLRLAVLLAPPLDAYGIVPQWGEATLTPDPQPSVAEALAEVGLSDGPRGRVRTIGGGERATFEEAEATRLFLERFERLLVECDEWRRRALASEDRLVGVERQLRTVERRAEATQSRLDAASEKLRAWGEFTRKMQQLARQADAMSRSRPSRPRDTAQNGSSADTGTTLVLDVPVANAS